MQSITSFSPEISTEVSLFRRVNLDELDPLVLCDIIQTSLLPEVRDSGFTEELGTLNFLQCTEYVENIPHHLCIVQVTRLSLRFVSGMRSLTLILILSFRVALTRFGGLLLPSILAVSLWSVIVLDPDSIWPSTLL